ncbi:MAG: hypothetical protein GY878_19890 [Fuerstiella sp.]|nr:hypothetical protein [Fuerstiella sp.]
MRQQRTTQADALPERTIVSETTPRSELVTAPTPFMSAPSRAGRSSALRVLTAFLLFTSLLTWVPGSPTGAWSSDDGAVAVFGGSGSSDYGYSVAVDSSGNVYTTGKFYGTVDFDPGAGTTNLTSNGGTDVFVSKLDSSGDLVWAKSFGDTAQNEIA